jgi:hypothetical protein
MAPVAVCVDHVDPGEVEDHGAIGRIFGLGVSRMPPRADRFNMETNAIDDKATKSAEPADFNQHLPSNIPPSGQ